MGIKCLRQRMNALDLTSEQRMTIYHRMEARVRQEDPKGALHPTDQWVRRCRLMDEELKKLEAERG